MALAQWAQRFAWRAAPPRRCSRGLGCRLGGQDFNLHILDALVARASAKLPGKDLRTDTEAMRVLREEAERVKIDLNDECDCGGTFYGDDSSPV